MPYTKKRATTARNSKSFRPASVQLFTGCADSFAAHEQQVLDDMQRLGHDKAIVTFDQWYATLPGTNEVISKALTKVVSLWVPAFSVSFSSLTVGISVCATKAFPALLRSVGKLWSVTRMSDRFRRSPCHIAHFAWFSH